MTSVNRMGLKWSLVVVIFLWTNQGLLSKPRENFFIDHGHRISIPPSGKIPKKYLPQQVHYPNSYPAGTIVVDVDKRFLYLIEAKSVAMRYGVSVGAAAFSWSGDAFVARKAVWPKWVPTEAMISRDGNLSEFSDGVPPGPSNPMGARSLYLYQNGRDTLFRIHGTSEYWSIGRAASSGCIRVLNTDIIELFERIAVGARVVVLPSAPPLKWRKK